MHQDVNQTLKPDDAPEEMIVLPVAMLQRWLGMVEDINHPAVEYTGDLAEMSAAAFDYIKDVGVNLSIEMNDFLYGSELDD